jgi:hypothetical protein
MDKNQTRHLSYDSPSQSTKNPIQNIDGSPNPRTTRPHPTTRQLSTSKNLHPPPRKGKETSSSIIYPPPARKCQKTNMNAITAGSKSERQNVKYYKLQFIP